MTLTWDAPTQAVVGAVNRKVNAEIVYDLGSVDLDDWEIEAAGGKGVCSEYAVTKRALLRAQGLPAEVVLLCSWTVPQPAGPPAGHLTVALPTDRGTFFLSNGYDEPLTTDDIRRLGWTPVAIEDPAQRLWVEFHL